MNSLDSVFRSFAKQRDITATLYVILVGFPSSMPAQSHAMVFIGLCLLGSIKDGFSHV